MMNRSTAWNIVKFAAAGVLVYFVISQTNLVEMIRVWQRLSFQWLVAGTFAFFIGVWLGARRYWILMGRQIAFRDLLGLVVVQTSLGNLVATSAGAASYAVLLRGRHQVQLSRSIASLVLARLGDLVMLAVGLASSAVMVWSEITPLHELVIGIIAVAAALIVLSTALYFFRSRWPGLVDRLVRVERLSGVRPFNEIVKRLNALAEQDWSQVNDLFMRVLIYSMSIFLLSYLFSFCNVRAFAVPIGAWQILFILSLTQIIGVIPVQVLGGLGITDVTNLFLFGLFGYGRSEIASVIIGWRIVFYVTNLLLLLYFPLNSRIPSAASRSHNAA